MNSVEPPLIQPISTHMPEEAQTTDPTIPAVPQTPPVSKEEIKEEEKFVGQMADRAFLSGPNWRRKDLSLLIGTIRDFLRGFRALHFVGPCITVFGSARTREDAPAYKLAMAVGAEIAKLGFTVMTGGGGGIMEAANRGAKEVGGRSVGCNIILPQEQEPNRYLDKCVTIDHFLVRKTLLMKYSYGFVIMQGGVGTMDEMFEAFTLIQTKKIRNFPIVLMGKDYWQPLMDFLKQMETAGTISPGDLDLIYFTDSVEDAMTHLRHRAIRQFGLRRTKWHAHYFPWLGERGWKLQD